MEKIFDIAKDSEKSWEIYTSDGQHPRVSYCTLGYSLAAFLQYHRQK